MPAPGAGNRRPDHQREQSVEQQGQHRHHQRADQRDVKLAHLDAVDEIAAQPAEAGVGGDRRGGDHLQCRGAQPAQDQGQRVGHLHPGQHPPVRHAHRGGRIDDPRVDVGDTGIGARQQWRHTEQGQRDRRRQ